MRACTYAGASASNWDVDLIGNTEQLDESLKRDIFGARRRVLFVEGDSASLDAPLYALVFPNTSVVPKIGCRDVINAVTGVRGAADLHWVRAFGLIDNDNRSAEDVDHLKQQGVYALSVFAVESVYYHPEVQRRVVERHAAVTGRDPALLLKDASDRAIDAIRAHVQRLSERIVERKVRDQIEKQLPTSNSISSATPVSINIDVGVEVSKETVELTTILDKRDLHAAICRYPVRETQALSEIARRLGFQGREQYESSVRKLLLDDSSALGFVRSLFAALATELPEVA